MRNLAGAVVADAHKLGLEIEIVGALLPTTPLVITTVSYAIVAGSLETKEEENRCRCISHGSATRPKPGQD